MTSQQPNVDIGSLKRLKITCISETGWFDNATLLADVKAAGGMNISQYAIAWPPFGDLHADNAAGASALIEAEASDGILHRFLFDTGWGPAWMAQRFAAEGIDEMLRRGDIEGLIISHEHFDHFWGIGATLKHCPPITLYLPAGFQAKGLELIKTQGHRGKVVTVSADEPVLLFPGCALVNFNMQTILQVSGENVLYFHIEDKGMAVVTGCGHGGIVNLLEYARNTFKEGDRLYAVYGGLHISPFEEWDETRESVIEALRGYNLSRLGCNHCTGVKAVQKMLDAGLPVVRGTARHGSKTELFLGNGDVLEL